MSRGLRVALTMVVFTVIGLFSIWALFSIHVAGQVLGVWFATAVAVIIVIGCIWGAADEFVAWYDNKKRRAQGKVER